MEYTNNVVCQPAENGMQPVQFESIVGRYTCQPGSDRNEITSSADSMPTKTFYLNVPQGKIAVLTGSLEVDDWGYMKISKINTSTPFVIDLINLLPIVEAAGPRGGHAQWTDTRTVHLPAGQYAVEIWHENATYPEGYDAHYNVALCNYDINIRYIDAPSGNYPVHINVVFDTRSENGVNNSEKDSDNTNGTYCASGYVFTGTASAIYVDGSVTTFAVQTGGWMASSSPFRKPTQAQLQTNFDPKQWPDTACPASATAIQTNRTGRVMGYEINVPASTGRTAIKLHLAHRTGSEGCISTHDTGAWTTLVEGMTAATSGFSTIGFSIFYNCNQPQPSRYPNQ